jgi:NAD(P)-dependent dehydrogenase (short-subunit alcohol dehydrogenase family)
MTTALITGANRGIGLELARQYAAAGWQVYAAARDPAAAELRQLAQEFPGSVHPLGLDVTDAQSVQAAGKVVGNAPIDHLINCAGVMGGSRQQIGDMDYAGWAQVFDINTMGPLRVTEQFVDNLARGDRKLAVTITSGMGSLADNTSGGHIAYRASKAAVNMVMRSLAIILAPRGIICIVINPGWVKTRMGGPGAKITAAQSVQAMRKVFESAGPAQTGKFFNYDGAEYPW